MSDLAIRAGRIGDRRAHRVARLLRVKVVDPCFVSREFGPTAQSIANWIAQDGRDSGTPLPGKGRC